MPATTDASKEHSGRTYILVHGAWHGGWCWRDICKPLENMGHRVFTPTLTGLADRKHLLSAQVGLSTHIADITNLIDQHDLKEITLVGHSYGGMVITGVADALKERLRHIVYLDAALPKDGQSMITQGPERSPDILANTEQGLRALVADGIAMSSLLPEMLGIPEDHPSYDWVSQNMSPHPLKSWLDPIDLPNGGSNGLSRTYIHCTDPVLQNASFAWHAEQVQANEQWQYHALETGHEAMITAPAELLSILTNIS
ncbi:MAG: alpha/beta fold hydrolase [Parasphingorhabdus sp.]|uniref:alpha/beta fold hydrolase n=1 Tax=Parasphingorhabdus sp. TaxID=2709688 RepID=UPI003265364A